MLQKRSLLFEFFPLYLIIFTGFLGYSLMIALFVPMFLHGDSGIISKEATLPMRTISIGSLLFMYPFGQFLGSPILGALSDHFGRKPVLKISLVFVIIFYICIALSLEWMSFPFLLASSFLTGLFEGNIALAQSAIPDLTDNSNRMRYFGYIYLSTSSAFFVGPLLGGRLADPELVRWFNYATPFWAVILFLAIILAWFSYSFQETEKTKVEHPNYFKKFTNLATVFTDKEVRKLYLANFLFYIGIFGFLRSYPMYLVDAFQLNASQVSWYISWVALPIITVNLFLARRFKSPRLTAQFASIWMAIFMVCIVLFPEKWTLWPTLFLTSAGVAILLPSCAAYLSANSPPGRQGQIMGNNQALQVGAEALSGLLGGLIAAIAIFLPLFVLAVISILGAWVFFRVSKKP